MGDCMRMWDESIGILNRKEGLNKRRIEEKKKKRKLVE